MPDVKYRVYPTLLNEFQKFLQSPTEESKQRLLNRINRVQDFDIETLQKFKKGTSFEEAVVHPKVHNFDSKIINEAKMMLPTSKVLQMSVKFIHQNILFYGFADVVGEGRVIDIKTTSSYLPPKFLTNFQTLYLYGLKEQGCKQMEYLIYDFQNLHVETYSLETFDFSPMLKKMELFSDFLEENKFLIKDKKIFVEESRGGLF